MRQSSEEKKDSPLIKEDNPVVFLDVAIGPEKGILAQGYASSPPDVNTRILFTILLLSSGKNRHRTVQGCRAANRGELPCVVHRRKGRRH